MSVWVESTHLRTTLCGEGRNLLPLLCCGPDKNAQTAVSLGKLHIHHFLEMGTASGGDFDCMVLKNSSLQIPSHRPELDCAVMVASLYPTLQKRK